nr:unnamed protein product [Digitaria exilis]
MPKRYRRDDDDDDGGRGGSRDQRRRHHLCVVLDEWSKGYSLYNLDHRPDLVSAAGSLCHAAHPDGRTVPFSADGSGTFAFDAEAEAWARHGEWVLPFKGQAFYEGEAEAWVGLSWAHVGEGRRARCYAVRKKSNTFSFRAFGISE